MATIDTILGPAGTKAPSPAKPTWLRSNWGILLAVAALVAVLWLLAPEGPQNMLAYGTETFDANDFVRTDLVLTVIALALVMLLGATYWHWLSYV